MRRVLTFLALFGTGTVAVLGALLLWTEASMARYRIDATDSERAVFATAQVYQHFDRTGRWLAYLGGLSSRRLPAALRLPTGLADFLAQPGDCDGKARALVYILSRLGMDARQFNLFGPRSAHTVVQARIDGRWRLLDPYVGVLFRDTADELAGWDDIAGTTTAVRLEELSPPRGDASAVYATFVGAVGAFEGEPVAMPVRVKASQLPLTLGRKDLDSEDVAQAAEQLLLGVGLHFLGPKLGSNKGLHVSVKDLPPASEIILQFSLVDEAAPPPPMRIEPARACESRPGVLKCRMRANERGAAEVLFWPSGTFLSVELVDTVNLEMAAGADSDQAAPNPAARK